MDFRIRTMRHDDLPAIVELEKLIFPDPWSYEAFKDGLEFAHSGGCVAEVNSASDYFALTGGIHTGIIGYVCFYSAAEETHLTNMAVAPNFRRKKIAQALMAALFTEAHSQGSDAMFLEVRESNSPARRLYEGYGFVELYTRKAYYSNPCEDAIVYVCDFKNDESAAGA